MFTDHLVGAIISLGWWHISTVGSAFQNNPSAFKLNSRMSRCGERSEDCGDRHLISYEGDESTAVSLRWGMSFRVRFFLHTRGVSRAPSLQGLKQMGVPDSKVLIFDQHHVLIGAVLFVGITTSCWIGFIRMKRAIYRGFASISLYP